jgi:two-component system, NarL family, invasion response regulator UvrY
MIRVAIVDQQAVARVGVRHLLAVQEDMRVVAEACDRQQALAVLRNHEIDVMLLDLAMQGLCGFDAMLSFRAHRPALPILVFSSLPETRYAIPMLRKGASGYLGKDAEPAALVQAIRWVHQGRRYVTPHVADLMASAWGNSGPAARHELLSDRELQVFLGLARGDTLTAVADRMCLSIKTISTYRSRTCTKLSLSTNSELTYYALKHGLID